MGSDSPVLVTHFLQYGLNSTLEVTEMDAGRMLDISDGLQYEFYLAAQRLVLLIVHLLFVYQIKDNHLACCHCQLQFLLFLLLQCFLAVEINACLCFGHFIYNFMKFLSLNIHSLFSLFFLQLFVSDNFGHLFIPFLILLLSRFVVFTDISLVIGEFIDSFFKNIEKRVFSLLGLVHQLYNKSKRKDSIVFDIIILSCLSQIVELTFSISYFLQTVVLSLTRNFAQPYHFIKIGNQEISIRVLAQYWLPIFKNQALLLPISALIEFQNSLLTLN